MMKAYRKWDTVPVMLIVALVAAWWVYTSTDAFKARKLIAELRYCKRSSYSPTGRDRWLFTAALATPGTRSLGEVCDELVAMGESAIPWLVEEARKPGQRNSRSAACVHLLGKIGTPAIRPLLKILADLPRDDGASRTGIIRALGAIGPPATEAIPMLLRELTSDNPIVRNFAAIALARIAPDVAAEKALPHVLEDLDHPGFNVYFYAAWALREIGPVTEEARTAFKKARAGKNKDLFP